MANLNTKVGVILARLQPIHNGHLALIDDEELKKYVPACVFETRKAIKQHIELSKLIT